MAESLQDSPQMGDFRRLHQMCMDSLALQPSQDARLRKLFLRCDRSGFGAIDGDTARLLFKTSGLPDAALFDIWSLADVEGRGELDYRAFCLCCVLIAYAQSHPDFMRRPDWMWDPQLPARLMNMNAVSECNPLLDTAVLDDSARSDMPQIAPAEAVVYEKMFLALDHNRDGFVEGLDARTYYLTRNELPDEELLRIWEVADADCDGRLSIREFMVMEHMVQERVASLMPVSNAPPPEMPRPDLSVSGTVHSAAPTDRLPQPRSARSARQPSTNAIGDDKRMAQTGHEEIASTASSSVASVDPKRAAEERYDVKRDVEDMSSVPVEHRDAGKMVGSEATIVESRRLANHVESLKKHAEDLEHDLDKLDAENNYLRMLYKKKEDRMSELHTLHRTVSEEAEAEHAQLRIEERELNELQDRISAMRRQKMAAESEQQALKQALSHSEDAEQTMLRSIKNEQGRVAAIRSERLHNMRKRIDLLESIQPSNDKNSGGSAQNVRAISDTRVLHDSKGIRVAAPESVMERRLNPRITSIPHNEWATRECAGFQE
ncbi:EF hand domain conatining protein, putative [Babesia bigemina]|uniref:EF hand domain conatining protein, putative n=1 Tax=Babesia bigemina TaxID=5866 RepID=A0A061DEU5_BABBI|nr:EF hand domain conatining protein, putative [Babesia bigemina]CDR97890.1 EF hand domain conatining protein, putative [Babesia bigemina]|eukprot:XP_012770076.1 EF hand domain conatining protein, putative [Babesia bigemina]